MLPRTKSLRACCSLCMKWFYTPNPHHWHCLLLSSLLLIPWISTKLSLPPGSPPCPPLLGQVPFYRLLEHHALSSITFSMVTILHLLYVLHAKSLQWCPTLWDPMVYSLPGSPVQGILQARILEEVAMPSSRASSWPRDQTHVSYVSYMGRWVFTTSATWEAPYIYILIHIWFLYITDFYLKFIKNSCHSII